MPYSSLLHPSIRVHGSLFSVVVLPHAELALFSPFVFTEEGLMRSEDEHGTALGYTQDACIRYKTPLRGPT